MEPQPSLPVAGLHLDIGSDYAGSIRLPSHFCGIAGIKPTLGTCATNRTYYRLCCGGNGCLPADWPDGRGRLQTWLICFLLSLARIGKDPAIVPHALCQTLKTVELKTLRGVFHTDNGAATPIPAIEAKL